MTIAHHGRRPIIEVEGLSAITSMPGWSQAFAKVQPITRAADIFRALSPGGSGAGDVTWTIG